MGRIPLLNIKGDPGQPGVDGLDGIDGAPGAPGATGPKGADGSNVLPTQEAVGQAVSQFTATGSSTATEVNAWLSTPSPLGFKRLVGTLTIDRPLVFDGKLDATGATINLAPGSSCNMLQNPAVTATRTGVADAVVTAGAGSLTLTSSSAAFTSADVGRAVSVNHLAAGVGMNLYGTITSVASGVATVVGVARATESGGIVTVFGRDTRIELVGGTWNRGANAGTGPNLHTLRFRRVDGLSIRDVTVTSLAGKYAISLGDVTNYSVTGILFDSASDGLHIQGPARAGYVRDLHGKTHDDLLGITAADYAQYNDAFGDITGINAGGLYPDGGLAALKIIGGTGSKVRGVSVDGIYGTTQIRPVAICGDLAGPSDVDGIEVSNMRCTPADPYEAQVGFFASADSPLTVGSVRFRNIIETRTGILTDGLIRLGTSNGVAIGTLAVDGIVYEKQGAGGNTVWVGGSCTVDRLLLGTINMYGTNGKDVVAVQATAEVKNVIVSNVRAEWLSGTGYLVQVAATAKAERIIVRSVRVQGGSGVRTSPLAGTTVTFDDFVINHPTGGNALYAMNSCVLEMLGGVVLNTWHNNGTIWIVGTAASLSVRGVYNNASAKAGIYKDGTQSLVVQDPGTRVYADRATLGPGRMLYNINAALACGIGPVVCDGTKWTNMATAAAYTP